MSDLFFVSVSEVAAAPPYNTANGGAVAVNLTERYVSSLAGTDQSQSPSDIVALKEVPSSVPSEISVEPQTESIQSIIEDVSSGVLNKDVQFYSSSEIPIAERYRGYSSFANNSPGLFVSPDSFGVSTSNFDSRISMVPNDSVLLDTSSKSPEDDFRSFSLSNSFDTISNDIAIDSEIDDTNANKIYFGNRMPKSLIGSNYQIDPSQDVAKELGNDINSFDMINFASPLDIVSSHEPNNMIDEENINDISVPEIVLPSISYQNSNDIMAGFPLSQLGLIRNNDLGLGIGKSVVDTIPLTNVRQVVNDPVSSIILNSSDRIEELERRKRLSTGYPEQNVQESFSGSPIRTPAVPLYPYPEAESVNMHTSFSDAHDTLVSSSVLSPKEEGGNTFYRFSILTHLGGPSDYLFLSSRCSHLTAYSEL